MQILGIGTDIIEIDCFAKSSARFMERCFTEYEREYLKDRHIENMAGLFAAKEAVAKALGTGFVGFRPSAIELRHDEAGKPHAFLYAGAEEAAKKAGIAKIEVSISHCKTYATAMAVAQSGAD